MTARIVEALAGKLTAPPPRKRPKNIDAYDLCVRARLLAWQSPQAAKEAGLLLQQAIALDSTYAEAHGWLALNQLSGWMQWGGPDSNRSKAIEMAQKAVALDPDDAACHWILGFILAYESRWAASDAEFSAALELNPNDADAWVHLSDISVLSGRVTESLEQVQKAFRLNPHPASNYYWMLGQAQYAAYQYEAAVKTLRREETYRTASRRVLAASLAQLGRLDEARREAEFCMVTSPLFRVSFWATTRPFRDEATLAHFVDGFRKAGLPE